MYPKRKINLLNSLLSSGYKFLDVGCATGFVQSLIKKTGVEYYGIDYDQEMLDECKKKGLKVEFVDLNLYKLPFSDNTFDIVYCSHVIEHFSAPAQISIFSEFARILKEGGKVLIYTPTGYYWTFNDDETHQKGHSHVSLSEMAKNVGFKTISCKYSLTRKFPQSRQGYFRLPPWPFYLTEVFLVAEKKKNKKFSKRY